MGAWGYKNLENDTAADFLESFSENPSASVLVEILLRVNNLSHADKFLDASDCEEALTASEIVAASRNKPCENFPTDVQKLVSNLHLETASNYSAFHNLSVRAVWFVMEESELHDLWEEAGNLTEWRLVQEDLLNRLGNP